jgi:sulfonate transport system substrate-binding protein
MTIPLRSTRPRWLVASAVLLLSACGAAGADSGATTSPTTAVPSTSSTAVTDTSVADTVATPTTEATVTVPEVPAGTGLRVGDQQGTLQRPLDSSGEAANLQTSPEYATFVGGPPLIEAFNAGALDVGYVGDTPPILALARGQDLVIVGAWRFSGNLMAIVAPPGKQIASVADLKGKSLAYSTGTALQAFAIRALKEAGLTEKDINHVDVPILDIVGALQSGDVDAGVLIEPILTSYLTDNPTATVVRDADGLTTGLQLVITTKATLEDPAKAAAIGDFVYREALAFRWAVEHPEESAQAFADANQISLEQAKLLQSRNGAQTFVPLDDQVIGPIQELADIFSDAGTIPEPLDVTTLFDDRFNPLVELANRS